MRTTFNLQDDIYLQVKHLSESARKPLGDIVSDLLRKILILEKSKVKLSSDFPVIPTKSGRGIISDEFINKIKEEENL